MSAFKQGFSASMDPVAEIFSRPPQKSVAGGDVSTGKERFEISALPTRNARQTNWRYRLINHDGENKFLVNMGDRTYQWSVPREMGELMKSPDFGGAEMSARRLSDIDRHHADRMLEAAKVVSEGLLQVHSSGPARLHATIQDGKVNPSFDLSHGGGNEWRLVPKARPVKPNPAKTLGDRAMGIKTAMEGVVTKPGAPKLSGPTSFTPPKINIQQGRQVPGWRVVPKKPTGETPELDRPPWAAERDFLYRGDNPWLLSKWELRRDVKPGASTRDDMVVRDAPPSLLPPKNYSMVGGKAVWGPGVKPSGTADPARSLLPDKAGDGLQETTSGPDGNLLAQRDSDLELLKAQMAEFPDDSSKWDMNLLHSVYRPGVPRGGRLPGTVPADNISSNNKILNKHVDRGMPGNPYQENLDTPLVYPEGSEYADKRVTRDLLNHAADKELRRELYKKHIGRTVPGSYRIDPAMEMTSRYGDMDAVLRNMAEADHYNRQNNIPHRYYRTSHLPADVVSNGEENAANLLTGEIYTTPKEFLNSTKMEAGSAAGSGFIPGVGDRKPTDLVELKGMTEPDVLGHELIHRDTMGSQALGGEDALMREVFGKSRGHYKAPKSQIKTYPEQDRAEIYPPLGANQRSGAVNGRRPWATPGDYLRDMAKFDKMDPSAQKEFLKTVPMESRRLYNYRTTIMQNPSPPISPRSRMIDKIHRKIRLWKYDKESSRLAPGVVMNSGGVPATPKRAGLQQVLTARELQEAWEKTRVMKLLGERARSTMPGGGFLPQIGGSVASAVAMDKLKDKGLKGKEFYSTLEQLKGVLNGTQAPIKSSDHLLRPFYTPTGYNPMVGAGIAAGLGAIGGGVYHLMKERAADADARVSGAPRRPRGSALKRLAIGAGLGAGTSLLSNFLLHKADGPPTPPLGSNPFPGHTPAFPDNTFRKVGRSSDAWKWRGVLYGGTAVAMVAGVMEGIRLEKAMLDTPKIKDPKAARKLLEKSGVVDGVPIVYSDSGEGAYYMGPTTTKMVLRSSPLLEHKLMEEARARGEKPEKSSDLVPKGMISMSPEFMREGVVLHEGGHAQIRNLPSFSPSRINQRFLRPAFNLAGTLSPLVSGIGGAVAGNYLRDSNPLVRGLVGGLAGLGVGAVLGAPELINERQATNRAIKGLENLGRGPEQTAKERKALGHAFNTYLISNLVAPAATGALGGMIMGGRKSASLNKKAFDIVDAVTMGSDKMDIIGKSYIKEMIMVEPGIDLNNKLRLMDEVDTANRSAHISPGDVLGPGVGALAGYMIAKSQDAGPVTTGIMAGAGGIVGHMLFKDRGPRPLQPGFKMY